MTHRSVAEPIDPEAVILVAERSMESRMSLRTFARAFGVVFLLIGIGGFIPGATAPHSHPYVTVQRSVTGGGSLQIDDKSVEFFQFRAVVG